MRSRNLSEKEKDRLAKMLLEESQRDGEAEDTAYFHGNPSTAQNNKIITKQEIYEGK